MSAPLVDVPILFEDDRWLVVDKPAGWHVNRTDTARGASVEEHFADRGARVVHRLDRGTTGVLVLAKGRVEAAALSSAFAERRVRKRYWAVVEGTAPEGVLDRPIGRDRRRPRARAVGEGGQEARTEVEPLGHGEGLALVEARPFTGRTHQIRVHLADAGAPIVGDTLYGGPAAVAWGEGVVRPARPLLHALELVLPGPEGPRSFRAPLPADLSGFAERLAPGPAARWAPVEPPEP